MVASTEIDREIRQYLGRLDALYGQVKSWVLSREPDARFTTAPVELDEQMTGSYEAPALEIALPGKFPIRLVPCGIFMVGAHGCVDARSQLGNELLVWMEPAAAPTDRSAGRISHPLYPGVPEGWAWADPGHDRVVPLTDRVFWDDLIPSLTE